MGIPSYFGWLCRMFGHSLLSDNLSVPIDNFYLDFNCAIHPTIRPMITSSSDEMNDAIIGVLNYLITSVNPQKRLFLAIDGVAPMAKMKQQRLRRFKAIQDTHELNTLKAKYNQKVTRSQHDFNMISPATEFMETLSPRIHAYLSEYKKSHPQVTVILSDSTVVGEGEHKIMNDLKQRTLGEINCIYGLDSDLIMLALCKLKHRIYLFREDSEINDNHYVHSDMKIQAQTPKMLYFNIQMLSEYIYNVLNPNVSVHEIEGLNLLTHQKGTPAEIVQFKQQVQVLNHGEDDSYRLIQDYVFMGFLLGNDFVAPVECLKIRENGIDQVIYAYKKTMPTRNGGYLVSLDGELNLTFLTEMVKIIASSECDLLKAQKAKRDKRAKYSTHPRMVSLPNPKGVSLPNPKNYEEAKDQWEQIAPQVPDPINAFADGWKERYYSYFYGLPLYPHDYYQSCIREICREYLRALYWIHGYYTKYTTDGLDWQWFNRDEATPLMSDFAEYLVWIQSNPNELVELKIFKPNPPVPPLTQLFCILPYDSGHLLPVSYRNFMADQKLSVYFPEHLTLETYGKRYRWECHPHLRILPPNQCQTELDSLSNTLTTQERQRNQHQLEQQL
jgi:5'-3' exonuclease